ncbi:MAG: SMC-Scp complex subunit ScpB, partial [Lachnospiraceae bacterium]|nr:SMC-Scp complex subunit ScpB [Lachnospiraceae bacterium]
EVLAIVAYKQPVTKIYIEQVRGVDSAYTLSSLVDKGLVEDCGRLDVPGRPILYQTTETFLRAFGLSSVSQLPALESFGEPDPQQMTFRELEEQNAAEQNEHPEEEV